MRIGASFDLETHQPQHIAQILPDVLARYGLEVDDEPGEPRSLSSPGLGVSLAEALPPELSLSLS